MRSIIKLGKRGTPSLTTAPHFKTTKKGFAVSASDDSISVKEDNEIRRIADELRLTHTDFIAARSEFRDRLSVLRKPPEGGR